MASRDKNRHKPRHHTHAVKPSNLPKKTLPPPGEAAPAKPAAAAPHGSRFRISVKAEDQTPPPSSEAQQ